MRSLLPKYRPFNLSNWLLYYLPYIREVLSIPSDDVETTNYWHDQGLISNKTPYHEIFRYEKSICIGASPELETYTTLLSRLSDVNLVSADGATRWLLEHDHLPDLVVSDLDGMTMDHLEILFEHDIPIQILVHGDNIPKVEYFVSYFDKYSFSNIQFSTQGQPNYDFVNTLGFTDGDRAVSIASQYSDKIYLLGFNLQSNLIGRYSKPEFQQHQEMTKRKRIKLEIAREILDWIARSNEIYIPNYLYGPGIERSITSFLKL